jgi:hypothetical protein
MSSGIGPNLILPGGQGLWQAITGQSVWDTQKGPPPIFGTDPMGAGNRTIDWGKAGGFVSGGPQSYNYQAPNFPFGQDPMGAGGNTALFGHTYNPAAGQSAYERFNDSGSSYLRRFGTDVRVNPNDPNQTPLQPELDAQGNPVGFGQGVSPNSAYYDPKAKLVLMSPERSAGLRSAQDLGGRDQGGNPLYGSQYDTARTYAGLAQLQQGANPWLNDPRQAAAMVRADEADSPFARANPTQYLATMLGAEGTSPTVASAANSYVNPAYQLGGRGVAQMGGLVNSYEQQLMDQMAQQGSKDLSLGIEDARNQLSSMGLGRSGQGQSTAAGVWRDIQEKNALDRQDLMAKFAEAGMGRQAQAILGQQTGALDAMRQAQQAAAQGAESRLGRANQAAMGGMAGLTASLEASRAAQRGALTGGMANTAAWNRGIQGDYLNALTSGDQAALQRMIATGNVQSQGLGDYMKLQATKDAMRSDRLNEMLALEDRYRTTQNEKLNQMAQYGMMGPNALLQMITGIQPTGSPQARTSPWANTAVSSDSGDRRRTGRVLVVDQHYNPQSLTKIRCSSDSQTETTARSSGAS